MSFNIQLGQLEEESDLRIHCPHLRARSSGVKSKLTCSNCSESICLNCVNAAGLACPRALYDHLVKVRVIEEMTGKLVKGGWHCRDCQYKAKLPHHFLLTGYLVTSGCRDSGEVLMTEGLFEAFGVERAYSRPFVPFFLRQARLPPTNPFHSSSTDPSPNIVHPPRFPFAPAFRAELDETWEKEMFDSTIGMTMAGSPYGKTGRELTPILPYPHPMRADDFLGSGKTEREGEGDRRITRPLFPIPSPATYPVHHHLSQSQRSQFFTPQAQFTGPSTHLQSTPIQTEGLEGLGRGGLGKDGGSVHTRVHTGQAFDHGLPPPRSTHQGVGDGVFGGKSQSSLPPNPLSHKVVPPFLPPREKGGPADKADMESLIGSLSGFGPFRNSPLSPKTSDEDLIDLESARSEHDSINLSNRLLGVNLQTDETKKTGGGDERKEGKASSNLIGRLTGTSRPPPIPPRSSASKAYYEARVSPQKSSSHNSYSNPSYSQLPSAPHKFTMQAEVHETNEHGINERVLGERRSGLLMTAPQLQSTQRREHVEQPRSRRAFFADPAGQASPLIQMASPVDQPRDYAQDPGSAFDRMRQRMKKSRAETGNGTEWMDPLDIETGPATPRPFDPFAPSFYPQNPGFPGSKPAPKPTEQSPDLARTEVAGVEAMVKMASAIGGVMEKLEAKLESGGKGGKNEYSNRLNVKAPDYLRFSGKNPEKYPIFRAQFDARIHSKNMPASEKLGVLQSLVDMPAQAKICMYPALDDFYEVALGVLDREYGDKEIQISINHRLMDELPIVKDNFANLDEFIDRLSGAVVSLARLEVPESILDAHVRRLYQRLPRTLAAELLNGRRFTMPGSDLKTLPTMVDFLSQLRKVNELNKTLKRGSAESQAQTLTEKKPKAEKPKENSAFYASAPTTAVEKKAVKCFYCGGEHKSLQCSKYPAVKDRLDFCMQKHVCFACLGEDKLCHGKDCPVKKRNPNGCDKDGCPYKTYHHASLCQIVANNQQTAAAKKTPNPLTPPNANNLGTKNKKPYFYKGDKKKKVETNMFVAGSVERTEESDSEEEEGSVMALIPVKIRSKISGKMIETHCLIDGGAEGSAMRKDLAEALGLELGAEQTFHTSVFGSHDKIVVKGKETELVIEGKCGNYLVPSIVAVDQLSTPFITTNQLHLSSAQQKILQEYQVINPPDGKTHSLGIILGIPDYSTILHPSNFICDLEVEDNLARMMIYNTVFGCIMYGAVQTKLALLTKKRKRASQCAFVASFKEEMQRHWTIESIGLYETEDGQPQLTEEELMAERNFAETAVLKDGHVHADLPQRYPGRKFGDNFQHSRSRLSSLLRSPMPTLQIIDNDLKARVARGDLGVKEEGQVLALPHWHVPFFYVHSESTTTPMRMVLDSAAKNAEGYSLNSILLPGPCYLNNLVKMCLRMRTYPILLLGDIAKAFNACHLNPSSYGLLQMLWVKDIKKPATPDNIITLYWKVLPFGPSSGPWLLAASIRLITQQMAGAAVTLPEELYVDDLLSGSNTEEEAIEKIKERIRIFDSAGMRLTKIGSNSQAVLDSVDEDRKAPRGSRKVLGTIVDLKRDTIGLRGFRKEDKETSVYTLRSVVRKVPQIYDPMGLELPITIRLKLLLHEMVQKGFQMDEPLPLDYVKRLVRELELLKDIPRIVFPRLIIDPTFPVSIIACSDASDLVCGGLVYLHQTLPNQVTTCHLVMGRQKLIRFKSTSTPKGEAAGLYIAWKLIHFVKSALSHLSFLKVFLYSDSLTMIQIIRNDKVLQKFFESRMQPIREDSSVEIRYWKGTDLPADAITRGLTPHQFVESIVPCGSLGWKKPIDEIHIYPIPAKPMEDEGDYVKKEKEVKSYFLAVTRLQSRRAAEVKEKETPRVHFDLPSSGGKVLLKTQPSAPPLIQSHEMDELEESEDELLSFFNEDEKVMEGEERRMEGERAGKLPPLFAPVETHQRRAPTPLPKDMDPEEIHPSPAGIKVRRFSNVRRLIRALLFVKLFIRRLKAKVQESRVKPGKRVKVKKSVDGNVNDISFSPEEYKKVTDELIFTVQRQYFAEVARSLEEGKPNRKALDLNVFMEDGLIRLKSRLDKSTLEFDAKYPLILPRQSHVVKLILRHLHEKKTLHGNVEDMMAAARDRYYVVEGHMLANQIVNECMVCRRFQGAALADVVVPPLPADRITRNPAFLSSFLDLFGPQTVLGSAGKAEKRWGLMVACAVTGGIRLQQVQSQSLESLFNSLSQVCNRTGGMQLIRCDNGTNFVALDKGWKAVFGKGDLEDSNGLEFLKKVENFTFSRGIRFHFSAPGNPRENLAERRIQVVKKIWNKEVGRKMLTDDEHRTLLSSCEAIVNFTPLTSIQSSGGPQQYLVPAYFTQALLSQGLPPFPSESLKQGRRYEQVGVDLAEVARQNEVNMNELWKRYLTHFLQDQRKLQLTYHKKRKGAKLEIPEVGQIFLLRSEVVPKRGFWPLCRVKECLTDADGVVRSVYVQVPNGKKLRRAVKELISLPLDLARSYAEEEEKKEAKNLQVFIHHCLNETPMEESSKERLCPINPPPHLSIIELPQQRQEQEELKSEDEQSDLLSRSELDLTQIGQDMGMNKEGKKGSKGADPERKKSFASSAFRMFKKTPSSHLFITMALIGLLASPGQASLVDKDTELVDRANETFSQSFDLNASTPFINSSSTFINSSSTFINSSSSFIDSMSSNSSVGSLNGTKARMNESEWTEDEWDNEFQEIAHLLNQTTLEEEDGVTDAGCLNSSTGCFITNSTSAKLNETERGDWIDEENAQFHPASDFHAQICRGGSGTFYLSVPPLQPECTRIQPSLTKHIPVSFRSFHESLVYPRVQASFCTYTKERICRSTDMGGQFVGQSFSELLERTGIPLAECETAAVNRTWKGHSLVWRGKQKDFSTNFNMDYKLSGYIGPFRSMLQCHELENLSVENTSIHSPDMVRIVSDRGFFPHNCTLQKDSCEGPDFTAFWKHLDVLSTCTYQTEVKGRGTLMGNRLIDSEEKNVYELDYELNIDLYIEACGLPNNSIATVEGVIISLGNYSVGREVESEPRSLSPEDRMAEHFEQFRDSLEGENPDNGRFHYLYFRMEQADKHIREEAALRLCQLNRAVTNSLITRLSTEPTAALRNIYQRRDLAAVARGDVLQVSICEQVSVRRIFLDYKIPDGRCFALVPVELEDGSIYFFQPLSRDLTEYAHPVSCESIRCHAIFKTSSKVDGYTIKGVRESNFRSIIDTAILDVGSEEGGFKTQRAYRNPALQANGQLDIIMQAIQTINLRQDALIHFSAELSYDPSQYKNIFESLGDGLVKVIQAIGGEVNEGIDSIFDGATGLISKPLKIISEGIQSWLIYGLVFVALIIGMGFLYCAYRSRKGFPSQSLRASHFDLQSLNGHPLVRGLEELQRHV